LGKVAGSKIGPVTGIFGKDDLKNVRNEPNLLLPDFLPMGLENASDSGRGTSVQQTKVVWAVPEVSRGRGEAGFPWFTERPFVGWVSPLESILSYCGQLKVWEQSSGGQKKGRRDL